MTDAADPRPPSLRSPKRGDLVVEEIKRWIAERRLAPGDKLPKEDELQTLFGVSKGTAREALKSLEVQGLVTVSTGPAGGATIGEVPLERAFQLLQNYLFFREMDVAQIYAVRRLLEPELAAGAVPHLTKEHFEALERSIATCAPQPASKEEALIQRQEDLHFHDVLAAANPNMLLRFMCQVINHLLRHSVAMNNRPGPWPTSSSARPTWPRTSACWRRRGAATSSACASSWSSISTRPSATSASSTPRCAGASSSIWISRRGSHRSPGPSGRRRHDDHNSIRPPSGNSRHGSSDS